MVAGWNMLFIYLFILNIGFTSSTFPIRPDFSQNQLAAITLNTGSSKTLPSKSECPLGIGGPKTVTTQHDGGGFVTW